MGKDNEENCGCSFINPSYSILLPVFYTTFFLIKTGSKGPIIFKQKRIGLYGNPFWIFKFRSMITEAEKDGPQLSSQNDPRITAIGKFMRKTRLDETPSFSM